MGETKPFGLLLGLMGNVLIALAMHKLLTAVGCTANLDTLGECTEDIGPAATLLPIGIVISTIAVFIGGGSFAFLGTFLGVGIGALWAGFEAKDDFIPGFAKMFGGIFVAVPLFLMFLFGGLSRGSKNARAKATNLVATGARAVGTVISVADTGMTINDNPRITITMRIEPEDRSPAFDATKTVTVSRVAIPRAGDRFPVWYDRNDPTQWAYGTDMNPGVAPPDVQAMFARAAVDGATAATAAQSQPATGPTATPAAAPTDTSAELTRLNDLRMKGVLTDEEFEAAKARLLGTTA